MRFLIEFSKKIFTQRLTLFDLSCIGGAIALLDGIYLSLHISGVSFRTIGYGLPRVCFMLPSNHPINLDKYFIYIVQVGNKAFADYLDANLSVTYINNKLAPPFFLSFFSTLILIHLDTM